MCSMYVAQVHLTVDSRCTYINIYFLGILLMHSFIILLIEAKATHTYVYTYMQHKHIYIYIHTTHIYIQI